jgi:hypothetical protein
LERNNNYILSRTGTNTVDSKIEAQGALPLRKPRGPGRGSARPYAGAECLSLKLDTSNNRVLSLLRA